MKCRIFGYFKDGPQDVAEMNVCFVGESHVSFEFVLKNGQKVHAGYFKEVT